MGSAVSDSFGRQMLYRRWYDVPVSGPCCERVCVVRMPGTYCCVFLIKSLRCKNWFFRVHHEESMDSSTIPMSSRSSGHHRRHCAFTSAYIESLGQVSSALDNAIHASAASSEAELRMDSAVLGNPQPCRPLITYP